MPTALLSVAICEGEGVFKHWRLFLEGPSDEEKIIFHIMGSSMNFRYETRRCDARSAEDLIEMIPLCQVNTSKIGAIEAAAEAAVIHTEAPGYNCQDYILELMDELEAQGIINAKDNKYMKSKRLVQSRVEGLF
ncbi:uncharacterized protein K489DRAFT_398903 [Dissoconium aciculare CBS 342.82]|uniref:Uncharacterized protein n=1 Tax=Dissoconium aciculare CBS 342.82 TaxID=1314786 RepID=A0A6J3MG57_9PEZI|nr:uncharacterized protein K489DRAFT_398903 [Dissoconium aciculare CBS 342.82]KAF1826654.1 hypothetical protein K489DRAFT_398903 [Dissoconium aciculare CBS 342.82]